MARRDALIASAGCSLSPRAPIEAVPWLGVSYARSNWRAVWLGASRIKEFEREGRRKDKALAPTAAVLDLRPASATYRAALSICRIVCHILMRRSGRHGSI
jgi:hypothetical protein